jgi:hypothetical protein
VVALREQIQASVRARVVVPEVEVAVTVVSCFTSFKEGVSIR